MWTIQPHEDVEKRLKKFKKKWAHEMKNVFDNLDTLHQAVIHGARLEQLKREFGFVHSEPHEILAIDQRGPGKGARMKPFRLYLFLDEDSETIHVTTIGDKKTQSADIQKSITICSEVKGQGHRKDEEVNGKEAG